MRLAHSFALSSSIAAVMMTLLCPASGQAQRLNLTNARVNRDISLEGTCALRGSVTRRRENVMVEDRRGRVRSVVRQLTTQGATCTMRERVPGFPQVRVIASGGVVYEKIGGGRWSFDDIEMGPAHLEGMPPVDRAALSAILDAADPALIFGFNQLHRLTAIRGFQTSPEAELWPDPLTVHLEYVADTDWRENRRIETAAVTLDCAYARTAVGQPWALRGCRYETVDKVVQSTRELASGESPPPNMLEQVAARAAAARAASMPQVEVPNLATEYDLVNFVYGLFHERPRAEAEAYLYRLFMPRYYDDGALNDQGEALLTAALDAAYSADGGFRGQYCRLPLPRDNVSWGNRGNVSYSRIAGRSTPAGFRLSAFDINVLHGRGLSRLAAPSTCTEELPGGYHLGDFVHVDYYGRQRDGFVVGSSGQSVRVMFGRSQNDVESMDVDKVSR